MAKSHINEEMWKDIKASRALLVVLGTPSHSWKLNEESERAEEREALAKFVFWYFSLD